MEKNSFGPEVHVERAGLQGPLLILLHGIGGSAESFSHQLRGLSDDRRLLAWDAPGYGRSPAPDMFPGTHGYLETIAGLIRASGEDRATVLGMSWGSVLAMKFALTFPDLVSALILGSPTQGFGTSVEMAERTRRRSHEFALLGSEEFAKKRARQLLGDSATSTEVQELERSMARTLRLPGYAYAAEILATTDLRGCLHALKVPTLVVYGSEDTVTGGAEAEAIVEEIAGAELVEISGAGHAVNREKPEDFNAHAERFLRSVG